MNTATTVKVREIMFLYFKKSGHAPMLFLEQLAIHKGVDSFSIKEEDDQFIAHIHAPHETIKEIALYINNNA